MKLIILLAVFSFSAKAHKECNIVGIPSGRDSDVFSNYMDDAEHITQVAKELGYTLPKNHHLYFVPSGDLAQLVANGRHALPHWNDGAKILSTLHKPSGVLEFVTKDSLDQANSRSYYSDTTGLWQQRQVIEHVMGHNDFSLNSGFHLANKNDTMGESFELYEEIAKLYKTKDHDEVTNWISSLYSLEMLQNLYDGTHKDLKEFSQEEIDLEIATRISNKEKRNSPDEYSGSLLRALVQKLHYAVPWKKKIAESFEAMNRHYCGNISTKIINEGWATFSQLLIHKHTKWVIDQNSALDSAALFFGVAYPKLTNPYFIGVETWKNIYKRFVDKLEKNSLSELEIDQKFVAHAHQIIFWMNSFNFIKYGLDEDWILKRDLALYREATASEIAAFCKQNHDCYPQEGERAFLVLSKNAQRITNHIARINADFKRVIPQIDLKSLNYEKRGVLRLAQRDTSFNIPLELESATQTLYIIAKMLEKPVELETFALIKKTVQKIVLKVDFMQNVYFENVLEQNADVTLYINKMKKAIQFYVSDLSVSQYKEEDNNLNYNLINNRLKTTYLEHNLRAASNFSGSSPSSGSALLEYQRVAKFRFSKMLKMAMHGDITSKKIEQGIRFRLLPIIPTFQYDQSAMQKISQAAKLAPIDDKNSLWDPEYIWGQDDLTQIASLPNLLPGDIFKQKDEQPDGQNSDSEDDPQENANYKEIDVPIKDWGVALASELELPNLRKTYDGLGEMSTKQKLGSIHKSNGDLILRKMVKSALRLAIADDFAKGKDPFLNTQVVDLMARGFSKIRATDHIVKNTVLRPEQASKAVVVFVLDFSGSMRGKAHQIITNFIFNFKALILKTYEDTEFRYVVYDDNAYEFAENNVIGTEPKFLGGTTNNVVGYEMARDILKSYDYAQWNKFLIGMADAGNSDGYETVDILNSIYPQLQFGAFIHTANNFGYSEQSFLSAIQDFANSKDFFSYAAINDSSQDIIFKCLKKLFPKKDK